MKLGIKIILSLLLLPILGNAQSPNKDESVLWIIKGKYGKADIKAHHLIMNGHQIFKMDMLDGDQIKERFGNIKEKTVLLVTLKPEASLLTLTEFFKQRKIDSKQYPTTADGVFIPDISKFLIDENSLQEVTVGPDSIRITTSNYFFQQQQKQDRIKLE